jgi:hypothetical protein
MNPPSTSQYNFLTDTSRFSVNLEVELPLGDVQQNGYYKIRQSLIFQNIIKILPSI